MKGTILALFCAVALVHAEINENGCPINPFIDVLKPHPNCNKYYQCLQGELFERKCASTLVFNVDTQECDWPENVDCDNRIPVAPESSEEESQPDNGGGNDDPSLAPEICAEEGSDGVLVAHENCNQFYECNNGVPVAHRCASTLLFNPSTGLCDWPENVNCGDRNPDGGDNGNGDGGNGDGGDGDSGNGDSDNGDGGSEDGGNEDGGNGDNGDGGNSDPGQAAEICAAEGSDGVLVAHENCNQFYKCDRGVPVAFNCWGNLLFNPANNQCDWPENVNCGDKNPDGGNGGGDGGNGDGGNGDGGNGDGGSGDGGNGDGGNGDGGNGGGGNDNPAEASDICAAEGSDGVLVAHENCNQFYKCNGGVPVALNCWDNLLFNPANDQCDWPENVNCGDRNPDGGNGDGGNGDSGNGDGGNGDGGNGDGGNGDGGNGDGGNGDGENGGNGGGGNDNPAEASDICAAEGSDGVLVAHENCNQFYKCNGGVPVALNCGGNLLFNPANDQCDWPENVNCGDRNPDGGNGGNGDGGSEDGGNGDGGNGDGGSEDGGNEDSGNGGNNNPADAPEICAAEDSEGVLVAHENCNQFYVCNGGKPVPLSCWGDLLFNPANNQCDWPENVNCDDRKPDGGNGGNGDGDNGDGDNGDSGSGGHTDPSLAPEICAAEDSDSVLVAHEDCNKYYICSAGVPVTRNCYGDLRYNPITESCDWPENVDCGVRRDFRSFNKHMPQVRRM